LKGLDAHGMRATRGTSLSIVALRGNLEEVRVHIRVEVVVAVYAEYCVACSVGDDKSDKTAARAKDGKLNRDLLGVVRSVGEHFENAAGADSDSTLEGGIVKNIGIDKRADESATGAVVVGVVQEVVDVVGVVFIGAVGDGVVDKVESGEGVGVVVEEITGSDLLDASIRIERDTGQASLPQGREIVTDLVTGRLRENSYGADKKKNTEQSKGLHVCRLPFLKRLNIKR